MSVKYLLERDGGNMTAPFLIVCEGMADARFLCQLLEHKKIASCQVGCPSHDGLGGGDGVDAIPRYLMALPGLLLGRHSLKGILIVIDADCDPSGRFSTIQRGLGDAGFPVPSKPFIIEPRDVLRVAVFIMPGEGSYGTLDNILLEAALDNNPKMKTCLDNFCDCTGNVRSWKINQQAKMKLSALVAASCQKNPWASAANMWSDTGCPVPIQSDRFNQVSEFLATFATMTTPF